MPSKRGGPRKRRKKSVNSEGNESNDVPQDDVQESTLTPSPPEFQECMPW